MVDFVIPKDNEEEFISMAEKLGYKELVFLYEFNSYINKKCDFINKKIKISAGIITDPKNIDKINSKFKNGELFIAIKSSVKDREIIENQKANLIFGFEENSKRDFLHQRGSGLDHILCKLVHENNVIIGLSLNSILNSDNKNIIFGRMMQNIRLCDKFKVKILIGSFSQSPYRMRSPQDLTKLLNILRIA